MKQRFFRILFNAMLPDLLGAKPEKKVEGEVGVIIMDRYPNKAATMTYIKTNAKVREVVVTSIFEMDGLDYCNWFGLDPEKTIKKVEENENN